MIYRFSITTSASTAETSKQKTVLRICKGIIHQIDVVFPSGCAGLCHLHINDAIHQVWPTNQGETFAGDNTTIRFREFLSMAEPPHQLEAYTWNDDDTYDHTITIRLGILPAHFIAPWLLTFEERIEAILGG